MRVIITVFAGSNSLTTFVTTIVSTEGGALLAGTLMVSMLSDVWMRVRVAGTGAARGVAAEAPSTATTEYATRLLTAGWLGAAWGFSGKAWDT